MSKTSLLLVGSSSLPPDPLLLQVGSLSIEFDQGTVRNIRLGDTLILQRIYSAVRDQNWATIPSTIRILTDERTEHSAHLVFESVHQQNNIDFIWTGTVHLTSTELTFEMDGEARSAFKKNRIGFCVLHDADVAGFPCTIEHVDGTRTEGQFPDTISPNQPYFKIRAIQHTVGQATVTVRMEGDTFEMEDQRNWSDASYKTYCTALGVPFPVLIEPGTAVKQKITLSVDGVVEAPDVSAMPLIRATDRETSLPALGLCLADESAPLGPTQIEALKALHLDHLRVDLEPAAETFAARLAYAQRISAALDVPLEVALWLNNVQPDLDHFSAAFRQTPLSVMRWLVFHRREAVTSSGTIQAARPVLRALGDAAVYGGTDAFFTHLNRNYPDPDLFDGLTYSTNPQVHVFDNASLFEPLEIQGLVVTNVQSFGAGLPIAVSPVTLKMRSNPDATSAPKLAPNTLPPYVDPRQMSLLNAVWTLGSIKYHAQAGASSVTYFTTHGMDGIMEAEGGSPLPDQFPTVGGVYPVYWVFHALSRLKGGRVISTYSTHSRHADAFCIKHDTGLCFFVFNNTPAAKTVLLADQAGAYQVRELSVKTLADAEGYRTQTPHRVDLAEEASLTLPAYGILIMEREQAHA